MTTQPRSDVQVVCRHCGGLSPGSFCALPEPTASAFRAVRQSHTYARNETIFMEGQPARGVYALCSGRVKLSTCSEDGKAIIVGIAEAGHVLGLSPAFTNAPHENTAQTLEECSVAFINKEDFLSLVRNHHEAALTALRQLSSNYYKAHLQICSLGLSSSAGDKLAKLLLQWCEP
jgi:CRP/FNR family cyclic AMP-dependent transcriptional regulator